MTERADKQVPDPGPRALPASLLTTREAAELLGVHERTIRRAIAHGELTVSKCAGVFRIAPSAVARYRARHAVHRPNAPSPTTDRFEGRRQSPWHVPSPHTPLFGREREIATVANLLVRDDVRLVTLIGPGGVGKTRLALDVAAEVRDGNPDGTWFVDLSPVSDPNLVPVTIAQTLALHEIAGTSPQDRLRTHLASRQVLLVLDNVEQVVAAGPAIATLLGSCPLLSVLATSRVPLHLSMEHRYPVPPLPLPNLIVSMPLERVRDSAAIRLFLRAAQAVNPGFDLTDHNARTVVAVCARLDGVPLAIELAAARSNLLSPAALLARLDRSLPLLADGPQDAPPRLRSMRDAIRWSYDLLDGSQQRLFRRLAVFTGGFTEDAAAFVGNDGTNDESTPMLRRLAALVESNLLVATDDLDGNPRFTMLATIQEFGQEELDRHQETAAMRNRHAAWVRDLVPYDTLWWYTGEQEQALATLQREHDNLRAALSWVSQTGDQAAVVDLVGVVWPFWSFRGHWSEGIGWLRQAQVWSAGQHTLERVRVLNGSAYVWMWLGDEPAGTAFLEESRAICDEIGIVSQFDRPDAELAIAANIRGDFNESLAGFNHVLADLRAMGDSDPRAMPGVSIILHDMGWLELVHGDLDRAEALANEALAINRTLGMDAVVHGTLGLLGRIAIRRGDHRRATRLLRESLQVGWAQRDLQWVVGEFAMLAEVDRDAGRFDRAALLLGVGNRIRTELGGYPADRMVTIEQVTNDVRERMGESAFAKAWEAGLVLSLEDALALGLQVDVAADAQVAPSPAATHGLTPREQEVLRLLANGQSNRAIAEALCISIPTVKRHVTTILSKLDLPSRSAATAFAHTHHLT